MTPKEASYILSEDVSTIEQHNTPTEISPYMFDFEDRLKAKICFLPYKLHGCEKAYPLLRKK